MEADLLLMDSSRMFSANFCKKKNQDIWITESIYVGVTVEQWSCDPRSCDLWFGLLEMPLAPAASPLMLRAPANLSCQFILSTSSDGAALADPDT